MRSSTPHTPNNNNNSSSNKTKQSKKRKLKIPNSMKENQSLEIIACPILGGDNDSGGCIQTTAVTAIDRTILLERFQSEIMDKFHFRISSPPSSSTTTTTSTQNSSQEASLKKKQKVSQTNETTSPNSLLPQSIQYEILKKRIIIGTNQCTRALESTSSLLKPSLVLLARDVRPPTILAHIPMRCKQLGIPIILLPGQASYDLGQVVGVKIASIVLLMERVNVAKNDKCGGDGGKVDECNGDDGGNGTRKSVIGNLCHQKLDSYIAFAKTKLPLLPI